MIDYFYTLSFKIIIGVQYVCLDIYDMMMETVKKQCVHYPISDTLLFF